MISRTTETFRRLYARLPEEIKRQAKAAYRLFVNDPYHTSLHFKRVHPMEPIYSARVGMHYRAVGIRNEDRIVWYWIGSHAEYDGLLKQM